MLNELFNSLPSYSWNRVKEEKQGSFERGYKLGVEEGFAISEDKKKIRLRHLTQEERDMVMIFLKENNLEFGYNVNMGGFYVAKQK